MTVYQVPHDERVENVTPRRFKELTGFTPKAVYNKIARGDWLEGYEFHRSPTGAITVYLPGYNRWAKGLPRVASPSEN